MSVKYSQCLVVSRHEILEAQKKDVEAICSNFTIIPELPVDMSKLKQLIQPYDAIIGTFPLNLQIQIIQNKKVLVIFVMTSLGVANTEEEAEQKASQYPGRTAILTPSKEGEKYRVTRYDGLKLVKDIKVVDEWLIQH